MTTTAEVSRKHTTRQVHSAQVCFNYVPKRARKTTFKVITVHDETPQDAIVKLKHALLEFVKPICAYHLLKACTFTSIETDYGDKFGPMISVPLFPEAGNHNYIPINLTIFREGV